MTCETHGVSLISYKHKNNPGKLFHRCPKCVYQKRAIRKATFGNPVTRQILESLGVDEKPDSHGRYKSSEVQVFDGGPKSKHSWGDCLDTLKNTPIPRQK